jgi:hypothetical protein
MEATNDKATCRKCGQVTAFQAGYLTESQKQNYECPACLEVVVENQVTTREMTTDGRRILTEDLPQ